jgi:hypothetical protein
MVVSAATAANLETGAVKRVRYRVRTTLSLEGAILHFSRGIPVAQRPTFRPVDSASAPEALRGSVGSYAQW